MRSRITLAAYIGGAAMLAFVLRDPRRSPRPRSAATYVGSERCGSCHPAEYIRWRGSHHALAMQPARDDTVLGDFSGASLSHHGLTWRFFRRGPRYIVTAEGPDGALHDYDVAYTFGVAPLQQYLIAFPSGRLQALSAAWDTRARRWFALDSAREVAPTDWLHWTRPAQTWNTMCADCHSTRVEKHYDIASDSYRTTFAELSVGCEACHGPGSRHTAGEAPMTPPRGRELVDACAACHSRRTPLADPGDPRQPLLDRYLPALLSEGVFHADGQILDEDFEIQSFWQSKMYGRGVTCSDCHDVHSGKLRAAGNALCTRCHRAATFDTPAHHRHAPATAGSQCTACHMPGRSYMVVHLRRDHSLRVPRPDLAEATGAPSACAAAGCHADRSAGWIASAFLATYGARERPQRWGPVLAAGRASAPEAEGPLAELATDASRPAIVRATALELLGRYDGDASTRALDDAIDDQEPLVRATAAAYLHLADDVRLARRLGPLCSDQIRAVRIAAAARIAEVPRPALDAAEARACAASLDDYIASQRFTDDMPSGPFNLGNLYASLGRNADAEREYQRAIGLDDQLVQAKVNLALLVASEGRSDEAERLLRAALAAQPDLAVAAFNLGLLLAERNRPAEAEQQLRSALAADPTMAAAAYNLAVLVRDRCLPEAHELFLRAAGLRPDDPRYARAAAETGAP